MKENVWQIDVQVQRAAAKSYGLAKSTKPPANPINPNPTSCPIRPLLVTHCLSA
jgi:hypothetical protein